MEVATEPGTGSKPPGGMEQMNRRGTQELTPSVTSEKEAHIGGWFKSRSRQAAVQAARPGIGESELTD